VKKRLAIGADHRGFKLKENLKKDLAEWKIEVVDFGIDSAASTDYPGIALEVSLAVSQNRCCRGILICGSGIGMSIVANKVKGVRAALCHDLKTARLSRQHNDANIMVINEGIPRQMVKKMLKVWLETKFEGGRHQRRINQIKKIERKNFK